MFLEVSNKTGIFYSLMKSKYYIRKCSCLGVSVSRIETTLLWSACGEACKKAESNSQGLTLEATTTCLFVILLEHVDLKQYEFSVSEQSVSETFTTPLASPIYNVRSLPCLSTVPQLLSFHRSEFSHGGCTGATKLADPQSVKERSCW